MIETASTLLIVGLTLVAIGGLLSRYFYQKRTITIEEPLFVPPSGAMCIPPTFKHSLSFRVPRCIRTIESSELSIEYFQGITYFPFEGLNSFLYEKLDVLPRALPYGLRGLFWSMSFSKVKPILETDFSARLTSSKISVAPEGWLVRKKGTRTPCRWRWDISCDELGKHNIVVELDEPFQKYFSDRLSGSSQVIFQVEVRSSIGLSSQTVRIMKYIAIGVGSVISAIATLIISSPDLQDFVSNILKQWLP